MIAVSFALVILLGALVLTLPVSSRQGVATPFLNSLFTATSATCVTGLVVYDTYLYWSPFGQGVILALIQIGGLGLVTITSFFNLMIRRHLSFHSLALASESVNSLDPTGVAGLVKMVFKISISVEALGALVLSATFYPLYGGEGIFLSIFLAVSAYCNAGFDLLGREGAFVSLTHYVDQPQVILPIVLLIVVGGLGFLVWSDLSAWRKRRRLLLHSRLVLWMTLALVLGGAGLVALFEWANPRTLGPLSLGGKMLAALFQSVTCRTAGFNSIDLAACTDPTKVVMICLMMVGAAPGSTGGGLKITTVAVLLATVYSVMRGRQECVVLHKRVPQPVVYKALTVMVMGCGAVALSTLVVYFTCGSVSLGGMEALFESASAFSTTGLSVGVTAKAGSVAKTVLILCMYLGRVGPVSLALALALPKKKRRSVYCAARRKNQVG